MKETYCEQAFDLILAGAADCYAQTAAQELECTTSPVDLSEQELDALCKRAWRACQERQRVKRPRSVRILKRASLVAASLFVVSLVSLNASSASVKVYKIISEMNGTALSFPVQEIYQKYREIKRFKHPDEIVVPKWMPAGMELDEALDEENSLELSYEGPDDAFVFLTERVVGSFAFGDGGLETENNQVEQRECRILGQDAKWARVTNERGLVNSLVVWTTDSVYYELFTNLDGNRLEALLDGLTYYRTLEGEDVN